MPRTRSLAWSELKIGIITLAALVLAAMLIFMVGGQGGFFWQQYHLRTKFPNVQGLKEGAVVRVAGVEVGQVSSVEFVGADVEVGLELSKEMQPRITNESRAVIGSLSLLGEPVIEISASTAGTPIPDGGYIEPGRSAGQIQEVAASATRGLEEATRLVQDVREGKGTIGKLFTDDQLYREISAVAGAAEDVATGLARGRGSLGQFLQDPTAYQTLRSSLERLDSMLKQVYAGEGSLGRLIHEDALAQSLTSASQNFDAVTGKLARGEGSAGKFVHDARLYDRLTSIGERVDQLVGRLNQGEGTLGQVLQDKQLYENMNGAVNEVRSLIADIRREPRRYLNVRVSIF
jgi:phospholipid/cholesterol/gamma-HCH transport system substrate-binding protein